MQALDLMRTVGGAPSIGPAELAEMRAIGPAVLLGEHDGDQLVSMVLCGRSPVRRDTYGIVWLGVHPVARGMGLGSRLLHAVHEHALAVGATRVVVGGRPGGYLTAGIDATRADAIRWFRKRGYEPTGSSADMQVSLADAIARSKRAARDHALVHDGCLVRRAKVAEDRVASWVGRHFGRGWQHEVTVALARRPAAVHVAERSNRIVGFAAHSARLAGLGTFGPMGVLPRHRGKGIGETLLWRCLSDLRKAGFSHATIAWVGPRDWYTKVCGAVVEREHVGLARSLR